MKYNYNNEITNEIEFISPNNRSFLFGDGVFETMMVLNNELRYIQSHHKRLTAAMNVLGLNSERLSSNYFENAVVKTLEANKIREGRVKFMVWRKETPELPGYRTSTSDFNFLVVTKRNILPQINESSKVSMGEKVKLHLTAISCFKTMNSLPYILADLERNEKGLDEMILTDTNGHVSECTSSNLFWIKNNQLYTPPLATGCIDGIMRSMLIDQYNVIEKTIVFEELKTADAIFSTNVARLNVFKNIDSQPLASNHEMLAKIKPLWVL